ncbi:MAG: hypothetical protein Q9171_007213, partial [Xanthocarpia ochracea]
GDCAGCQLQGFEWGRPCLKRRRRKREEEEEEEEERERERKSVGPFDLGGGEGRVR